MGIGPLRVDNDNRSLFMNGFSVQRDDKHSPSLLNGQASSGPAMHVHVQLMFEGLTCFECELMCRTMQKLARVRQVPAVAMALYA